MSTSIYEELLGHVRVLASPRMRGRVPMTVESEDARRHVMQTFEAAGLAPVEHSIEIGGEKHGTNVIAGLPAREGTTVDHHHAFREAGLPYLFLSAGYWQHYHASSDTIEHLDIDYMVQVVHWLEGLAQTACTAPPGAFKGDPFDRESFTRQEAALLSSLTGKPVNPAAVRGIIGALKGSML